jgi:hypothetical protein
MLTASMARGMKRLRHLRQLRLAFVLVALLFFVMGFQFILIMSLRPPVPPPDEEESVWPGQVSTRDRKREVDTTKHGGSLQHPETLNLKLEVPSPVLPFGIVIMAHNRPNYLLRVLRRLKELPEIGAKSAFFVVVDADL